MGVYDREHVRAPQPTRRPRALGFAIVMGVVALVYWFASNPGNRERTPNPNEPKFKLTAVRDVDLGEFDVVSGDVAITDPGYGKAYLTPGSISILARNVLKGTWQARSVIYVLGKNVLNEDSAHCAELLAFPTARPLPDSPKWKQFSTIIGVDTGQAGFFDLQFVDSPAIVPKDYAWPDGKADPENPWYSYVCEMTCGKKQAGVIPYGAVSSSGFGDGGYAAFALFDEKGTIVGLRLVFDVADHYDQSELRTNEPSNQPNP